MRQLQLHLTRGRRPFRGCDAPFAPRVVCAQAVAATNGHGASPSSASSLERAVDEQGVLPRPMADCLARLRGSPRSPAVRKANYNRRRGPRPRSACHLVLLHAVRQQCFFAVRSDGGASSRRGRLGFCDMQSGVQIAGQRAWFGGEREGFCLVSGDSTAVGHVACCSRWAQDVDMEAWPCSPAAAVPCSLYNPFTSALYVPGIEICLV